MIRPLHALLPHSAYLAATLGALIAVHGAFELSFALTAVGLLRGPLLVGADWLDARDGGKAVPGAAGVVPGR